MSESTQAEDNTKQPTKQPIASRNRRIVHDPTDIDADATEMEHDKLEIDHDNTEIEHDKPDLEMDNTEIDHDGFGM